eukprot:scaffold5878_cov108-Skeletonema_dohrnii-CCMP3373.AAC.3
MQRRRDYFNNFNTTRYPNPCKSVLKFYEVTRSAPKISAYDHLGLLAVMQSWMAAAADEKLL